MCGIVGVLQKNNVVDVAVKALCTLEYRGYDSYGVAALTPAGVQSQKDIGSITAAKTRGLYRDFGVDATLAIAHTRWATHGGVTAANAHPHLSPDGQFAVVHNGVIENHFQLREELEALYESPMRPTPLPFAFTFDENELKVELSGTHPPLG